MPKAILNTERNKNEGYWTLVTGAAKGLGAEICLTLADQGFPILVHYNTSYEEANALVTACRKKGVRAESIQGDLTSSKTTQDFIKEVLVKFPHINVLINNVGNYLIQTALNTSIEKWSELFETNLHAPFALCQALSPTLKSHKGSIINIGTAGLTAIRSDTRAPAYNITKMGLLLLTKSLAKELAPFDVRVNMVSPGRLANSIDLPVDLSSIPMKRLGTLTEVSQVVAFLLEKGNDYITGQNIEVAGGLGL
jgi:NAD(P)-dependent dehydrogenase (short-subunit alcohol dehydrogenase family)